MILDPVGGVVFEESCRCIAFGGRLLVVGFASGRIANLATNIALIKGFSVVGVRAGEHGRQRPDHGREHQAAILDLANRGIAKVHVGLSLPLSQTRAGLGRLMGRDVIGKAVVIVDDSPSGGH